MRGAARAPGRRDRAARAAPPFGPGRVASGAPLAQSRRKRPSPGQNRPALRADKALGAPPRDPTEASLRKSRRSRRARTSPQRPTGPRQLAKLPHFGHTGTRLSFSELQPPVYHYQPAKLRGGYSNVAARVSYRGPFWQASAPRKSRGGLAAVASTGAHGIIERTPARRAAKHGDTYDARALATAPREALQVSLPANRPHMISDNPCG